jgi:hypothetical protein
MFLFKIKLGDIENPLVNALDLKFVDLPLKVRIKLTTFALLGLLHVYSLL